MSMAPSPLDSELALRALAADQHGLFTSHLAAACGWSRQRLHRWQRSGRITRVHAGVYRFAGSPTSWEAALLAAVLACGPRACASHRSAMGLHGIEPARRNARTPLEVSIPAGGNARPADIIIHRVLLPEDHCTTVDGIPCTTYERTLIDSAAKLGYRQLARGIDQGLVTNRLTLSSACGVAEALRPAPGRRRARVLRLVDQRTPECEDTDSAREIAVLTELDAAGLPAPIAQCEVTIDGETFFIDAAYPDLRIGIEYQGFDVHRTRSAFDADHRRDRLLTVAGWSILYVTSATTATELVEHITRLAPTSRKA